MSRRAGGRRPLALLLALLCGLWPLYLDTAKAMAKPTPAQGAPAEAQTLRVGWYALPGYMELDDEGQPGGYVYAYLQTIAQAAGWRYAFVQGEAGALQTQLAQGEIDLLGVVFPDGATDESAQLSSLAAGNLYTLLFTTADSPVAEEDYPAFSGLRVGVEPGSPWETALDAFTASKGIRVTKAYYATPAEVQRAVRQGEADAGVAGGVQTQNDMRTLARFSPRSFYFAVASQQPEIARRLDSAMADIQTTDRHYQERLVERYLFAEEHKITFSQPEKAYLQSRPVLTVAYGQTWEPLLQAEGNAPPGGVASLILNNLTEHAGVTLRYVPLQTAERFDILCCVPLDESLAAAAGIRLSNPYLTLPLALVTRDGASSAQAAVAQEGLRLPAGLDGVPATLRYAPTARDALDAVLAGKQPAALLNSFVTDNLLQNARYKGLTAHRLTTATVSACFAVQNNADKRLLSILNKLVNHMTVAALNDYVIIAILESQHISLSTIADRMPADVAALIAGTVLVLAVLLGLSILHGMRIRRERANKAEIAAFLDYANKVNDDVWEVNIRTLQRWRYRIAGGEIVRVAMPPFTRRVIEQNVHPEDLPQVLRRVDHVTAIERIEALRQERFECRLLDEGEFRWARIVFQGMMPSSAHPANMMVYIMDVDDAVRTEEQKNALLKEALEASQQLSRAKGEFTAYISHEIRSPLNAMLGYLTLARSSIGQPQRLTDCFIKSEYAANHLLQLVNDVLDMGTLESGKMRLSQGSFDVVALMETLGAIYNAQAKSRGILYRVDAGAPPEPYLLGDDLRVKQVMVNLLSNAMKFTPRGGSVTLSARQTALEPGRVRMRFAVADTGIGMAGDYQSRLFTAYTREDAAIAGQFGGNGLGLSIAKQLVDLMGGAIDVISAPGMGSTFAVTMDFPVDQEKKVLVETTPDARAFFAGKRLLLVDDNDMNMEIATELLKLEGGFEIEGASNGREAVDKFLAGVSGTYDAILMDVRMPELDGYAATRAIRGSAHPDAATVPIVAMTANAFEEDIRLAGEAGMNGHIAKPIDIHRVLLALSEVLPNR